MARQENQAGSDRLWNYWRRHPRVCSDCRSAPEGTHHVSGKDWISALQFARTGTEYRVDVVHDQCVYVVLGAYVIYGDSVRRFRVIEERVERELHPEALDVPSEFRTTRVGKRDFFPTAIEPVVRSFQSHEFSNT